MTIATPNWDRSLFGSDRVSTLLEPGATLLSLTNSFGVDEDEAKAHMTDFTIHVLTPLGAVFYNLIKENALFLMYLYIHINYSFEEHLNTVQSYMI